jgi:hypothetical protein
MIKGLFILGAILAGTYGVFKFTGSAASLKQANDNLIFKFSLEKWAIFDGKFRAKVLATIINPDLNETFKLLYPQILLIGKSGYPFEASAITDETLKTKEYSILPRSEITLDPFYVFVSIKTMLGILTKIISANISDYKTLLPQILTAITTLDLSVIDSTLMTKLLTEQKAAINLNFKIRIISRLNGVQISYDLALV